MLRSDVKDVMSSLPRQGDGGCIQWLRIHFSVYHDIGDQAEIGGVDQSRSQNRFGEVLACPGNIVMPGQYVVLRVAGERTCKQDGHQEEDLLERREYRGGHYCLLEKALSIPVAWAPAVPGRIRG